MTEGITTIDSEKSFQIFKKSLLNNIKPNNSIYYELQKISKQMTETITILRNIEKAVPSIDEHEGAYFDETNNQYVNLVSPQMHQKILAYYHKHKNKTYSTKYKIDRNIHNFLMKTGRYLEKINRDLVERKKRRLEIEKRYYSFIIDLINRNIDYLAFLSKTLKKIAVKFSLIGTSLFYSLSFMSIYSPELMDWLKFVFIFNRMNDMLFITSYAISPNRKEQMKRLKHRIMEVLGIYRTRGYGLFIKFIYKLYDLLNAIMSFIKNLDIHLRGSRNWKDFYERLEKHMLVTVGISYKWLFDIISIDLVAVDEFLRDLGKYEELNIYRYRILVSPNAISRLKHYYGENVKIYGNWISVELNYQGGRYYTPDNPLDVKFILDVSGFDGTLEEQAHFVVAAILLSDKMILDNIYTPNSQYQNDIISIDLNQLKLLVYKDKSWFTRLIDRILGRDRVYLSPETIGDKLYESYIMLYGINNS
jgi:hypothetical protein